MIGKKSHEYDTFQNLFHLNIQFRLLTTFLKYLYEIYWDHPPNLPNNRTKNTKQNKI
jgi:hypothetical protein